MAPSTNSRRPLVTCSAAISASLSQQRTRCPSVVGVAPDLAGRSVARLNVAMRWPAAVTRDSGAAAARPSKVTRLYVKDMRGFLLVKVRRCRHGIAVVNPDGLPERSQAQFGLCVEI